MKPPSGRASIGDPRHTIASRAVPVTAALCRRAALARCATAGLARGIVRHQSPPAQGARRHGPRALLQLERRRPGEVTRQPVAMRRAHLALGQQGVRSVGAIRVEIPEHHQRRQLGLAVRLRRPPVCVVQQRCGLHQPHVHGRVGKVQVCVDEQQAAATLDARHRHQRDARQRSHARSRGGVRVEQRAQRGRRVFREVERHRPRRLQLELRAADENCATL
mmetsp:Transcript_69673/g.191215  ORF Transcript_69673/g.191215 Transcript_69673/m.191215 type:complete len:220 (+) Transcript_69673:856-1515(+)